MPEIAAAGKQPAKHSYRRVDLAVGIALGVILGLAVVAAFVFLGSEGAVDAPHVSGANTALAAPSAARPRAEAPSARQ